MDRWQRFLSDEGTEVFFRVAGQCLESVVYGHLDVSVATALQSQLDAIERAHGRMLGFHHWLHAPTYSSEFRASWIDWLRRNRRTIDEVHFLTRSRIVRLGLSVANIAYPHVEFATYADEINYIAARDRRMPWAPIPPSQRA